MIQQTLVLIKPDGVERGLVGEIIKRFEGRNIRVFNSETRGVSRAKNFGTKQISNLSDWIVFLDADTIIEADFLKNLNVYLNKNSGKNFAVGTTSVWPLENKSWYANSVTNTHMRTIWE